MCGQPQDGREHSAAGGGRHLHRVRARTVLDGDALVIILRLLRFQRLRVCIQLPLQIAVVRAALVGGVGHVFVNLGVLIFHDLLLRGLDPLLHLAEVLLFLGSICRGRWRRRGRVILEPPPTLARPAAHAAAARLIQNSLGAGALPRAPSSSGAGGGPVALAARPLQPAPVPLKHRLHHESALEHTRTGLAQIGK